MIKVTTRWMIEADKRAVCYIENESFAVPWTREEFDHYTKQPDCIGVVAEHAGIVLGFIIYQMFKRRLDILDLAVSPFHRRQEIGRQLIDRLKINMIDSNRAFLAATVSEQNLPGQLFLRECGFKAENIIKQPYDECESDAYRFLYVSKEERNAPNLLRRLAP